MSIREAIINSTRQTLSSYLAPELVEQLTEEIVHRMAPEMEAALTHLAGFEMGRPAAPARIRGATPTASKKAKAKAGKELSAPSQQAPALHAAHATAHHANGNGGAASSEVPPSH